jgi:hypothetical protein
MDSSGRTYTGESVPGEYHGPALRRDLVGIERVLNAALRDRMNVIEHAGGSVARDSAATDLMKAIEAVGTLKDMAQRMAAHPDMDMWGEWHG